MEEGIKTFRKSMETKKRLSREEKREQVVIDLINQMFIIAGHDVTYDDILGVENWFQKYNTTILYHLPHHLN